MKLNLSEAEIAEVFGENNPRQHEAEAQQRWGNTDAYKESSRRTSSYSKEDWQRVQEKTAANVQRFLTAMKSGLAADSVEAMDAAEAHRLLISEFYYDCNYQIHTGLAEMYVADERFAAHYNNYAEGLAQYISEAIHANAIARS